MSILAQSVSISASSHFNEKKKAKKNKVKSSGEISRFADILDSTIETRSVNSHLPVSSENSFGALFSIFERREQQFTNRPGYEQFIEYRDAIRQLCSFISLQAFKLSIRRDRNQDTFETVKVINEKLALLYRRVITPEPEISFLIRTMGQVRGLVLDLKC